MADNYADKIIALQFEEITILSLFRLQFRYKNSMHTTPPTSK